LLRALRLWLPSGGGCLGARKHDDGFSRCETRASGDVLVDFPLALTRGDER
jgi:hypothetical protein